MKEELAQQLVKQFPLCFGNYNKSIKESPMGFGLEVGDGWFDIIKEACEKAEPIIAKCIEENKHEKDYIENWAPRFSQIKEKFGSLRLYFTTYPDGIDEIEREAENKSMVTCEQCGKPGKLRGTGWYYTSCVEHCHENDRNNLEYLENEYIKENGENKNE